MLGFFDTKKCQENRHLYKIHVIVHAQNKIMQTVSNNGP